MDGTSGHDFFVDLVFPLHLLLGRVLRLNTFSRIRNVVAIDVPGNFSGMPRFFDFYNGQKWEWNGSCADYYRGSYDDFK